MAQIDLKNATITLRGGGSGEELVLTVGEGDITWSEKKNIEYTLDRGLLDEVREGDEVPMDVNMSFTWQHSIASDGGATDPYAALDGSNGWESTDTDPCRPYALDIEIRIDPSARNTNCVSGFVDVYLLPDYRQESNDHAVKAGTVSSTGKCNATKAIHTLEAIA